MNARGVREHTGVVAPLDRMDVDTDRIVPQRYLTGVHRTGYADALFHDLRYRSDGRLDPLPGGDGPGDGAQLRLRLLP